MSSKIKQAYAQGWVDALEDVVRWLGDQEMRFKEAETRARKQKGGHATAEHFRSAAIYADLAAKHIQLGILDIKENDSHEQ